MVALWAAWPLSCRDRGTGTRKRAARELRRTPHGRTVSTAGQPANLRMCCGPTRQAKVTFEGARWPNWQTRENFILVRRTPAKPVYLLIFYFFYAPRPTTAPLRRDVLSFESFATLTRPQNATTRRETPAESREGEPTQDAEETKTPTAPHCRPNTGTGPRQVRARAGAGAGRVPVRSELRHS